MKNQIFIILILATIFNLSFAETKCRALAMSGGGSKGAFEAGALRGLIKYQEPIESQYDVVTGVSAGALNAFGFSLFEKGKEEEAADFITGLWSEIIASDIYTNWEHGPAEGLLFEKGIFNNTPLLDLISTLQKNFTEFKRQVHFGIVDANAGEYFTADDTYPFEDIATFVVSSAAIPGVFPYFNVGNMSMVDGGAMINLDLTTAVQKCLEKAEQNETTVDIILAHPFKFETANISNATSLEVVMRWFEIYKLMLSKYSLLEAQRAFPDVNYRYLIYIEGKLPGFSSYIPFDFNHEHLVEMIDIGEEQARKVIQQNLTLASFNAELENINFGRMAPNPTFQKVMQ